MGETTCLMQPFSYAAGISSEAKEGNPVHAVGQSISFGRFMSESLAWEKWSTFSHNRYVEEAEKFSRPGSVAEKKAFYEAHYKNLAARKAAAAAAAAMLEETNATSNAPKVECQGGVQVNMPEELQVVAMNTELVAVDEQAGVQEVNLETSVVANDNGYSPNVEMERIETRKVEEVDTSHENQPFEDNCIKVESSSQLDVVDNKEEVKEMELSETKQMVKPLLKDYISNRHDFESTSKKKPTVSSSKLSMCHRGSKLPSTPARPATSFYAKKENNATPISKKSTIASVDKKKLTPKSTHKSMNFTPVREINRITSTIIRKIDSSRVGSNFKASKDCSTPLRTLTTVSVFEGPKHHRVTPLSEERRAKTPLHFSASGSKTVRSKWNFLPTDCSKFMGAHRNKSQSPSLSTTPFRLRTEERAAIRKEKLEEKFNADQAQKVQLQASLIEKAETELKKLRKSLCFKARPLPDFYKERVTPKNQMEKTPLKQSQPIKLGRKPNSSMIHTTSQLPQMSSVKNSGSKHVMGKNNQNPHSLASRLKAEHTCENISPNIQHK